MEGLSTLTVLAVSDLLKQKGESNISQVANPDRVQQPDMPRSLLKRLPVSLWVVIVATACAPAGGIRSGGNPSNPEAPVPAGTAAMPMSPAEAKMERLMMGVTPPGPVVYTIYPGDQLRVTVLNHQDLSFSFRVPTEGFITFPLIGRLHLTGRSLGDVEREIRERLEKDFLVNPQVSLLIESYSKKYTYVFGAVKEPKAYELPEGQPLTLTQVIAMSGGFSPDAAKDRVRVIRHSRGAQAAPATGEAATDAGPLVAEVDVTKITEGGNVMLDLQVRPGDVVAVPSLQKIYVLGQVKSPGGFPVASDQRVTVTQAISLAGGFTTVASERRVRVIRRPLGAGTQQVIVVDVWAVIQHGELDKDVELLPGDIVFVPESLF
jgi:polysaccharide export outer membrane protein